jgi:predicted phosphodiesterase
MRLLCISDIHGHADALKQALTFGDIHKCTQVLVAGDLLFPGPKPLATWQLLMASHAHIVQGVSDRAMALVDPSRLHSTNPVEEERLKRLRQSKSELGDVILARLARLPTMFRMATEDGGELLLVHGSPVDPTQPITHDMEDSEISALLGDEGADIVVCGASHDPFERILGPTRIVNVGSVGEAPTPDMIHVTIIETTAAGAEVKSYALPKEPTDPPDRRA